MEGKKGKERGGKGGEGSEEEKVESYLQQMNRDNISFRIISIPI
jgi:hypothetical protein